MALRHRLHRIVFVPLDDRPVNLKMPRLLADMVGYDLVTPPLELLGRFRRPGQPEEIASWLMAQASDELDCAILSLDMLAYGGLVASRAPMARTALAQERLSVLARLRARVPDLPIYAFNAIMRLSITATSDSTARYWELLRRYSELAGLADEAPDAACLAELQELERRIPAAVLGQYQAVRGRNHAINQRAVREVAAGNLSLLLLCQEDAALHGLHRPEQRALQSLIDECAVGERALILPGCDEAGALLLVRFISDHMGQAPAVRVIYPDGLDGSVVGEFEDRPFTESLDLHLRAIGGRAAATDEEPDMILAVNPPVGVHRSQSDPAGRTSVLESFAAKIAELVGDRGVAICDASFANGAEEGFLRALLDARVELPRLLSFAGWNTASNSVGSALAHACLRLIALQDKGAFDLAHLLTTISPMRYLELLNSLIDAEKAHVQLLFTRFVDDWLYQTQVRPEVTEHAVHLLRVSVFDLRESVEAAERMVREMLAQKAADLWIDHFLGRTCVFIGSPDHRSSLQLAELEQTRVTLPWQRLFEVDLDFDFGVEFVASP